MSIKPPTVSIIIVVGTKIEGFSKTVNSILRQTFTNFEILIFHKGDRQQLVECYDRWSDFRLRLFWQESFDTARIFNLGIKIARGKYLAFLKANDLWHPDKLQKQVFYLDRYPGVGLVHSWLVLGEVGGKSLGKVVKHELSGWVELEILERNQINCSSVAIRRACFDVVGLFDPTLQTASDWDMWIRLSRHYQFMAIAEPLVYCRQHRRVGESWLAMETDFQATIEKAYQNAPRKLLAIKDRSYAHAGLSLAWQVLRNQNPDPVIADNYCRQALEHSLSIGFSWEFVRVSLAVLTLRYLKGDRYNCLLLLLQAIQTRLQIISKKFEAAIYFVLNWMLEEETQKGFEERGKVLRSKE